MAQGLLEWTCQVPQNLEKFQENPAAGNIHGLGLDFLGKVWGL